MKTAIKTRWLKALRSGEYKQARNALRDTDIKGDGSNKVGYCCLGVLTDLYINSAEGKKNKAAWNEDHAYLTCNPTGKRTKTEMTSVTPSVVRVWAGLEESDPPMSLNEKAISQDASEWNDNTNVGFNGIAKRIEATL